MRRRAPRSRAKRVAAVIVTACAAGALFSNLLLFPRVPVGLGYRYTSFATEAMDETQPAWSPDGQSLAYIAAPGGIGQVFTRSLNSSVPAQITHSNAACSNPFWSPDGTRIYYRAETGLWSVGAVGGAPQRILENIATVRWGRTARPYCRRWNGAGFDGMVAGFDGMVALRSVDLLPGPDRHPCRSGGWRSCTVGARACCRLRVLETCTRTLHNCAGRRAKLGVAHLRDSIRPA